jgi:hypothetical protein
MAKFLCSKNKAHDVYSLKPGVNLAVGWRCRVPLTISRAGESISSHTVLFALVVFFAVAAVVVVVVVVVVVYQTIREHAALSTCSTSVTATFVMPIAARKANRISCAQTKKYNSSTASELGRGDDLSSVSGDRCMGRLLPREKN